MKTVWWIVIAIVGFFALLLFGIMLSNANTKLIDSQVPCRGANYGNDIPEYQQIEICEDTCDYYGLEYFNHHCFSYLKCSCK